MRSALKVGLGLSALVAAAAISARIARRSQRHWSARPSAPVIASAGERPAASRLVPLGRPMALAYSLFLCVMVPAYWRRYGPANFLWFSDIGLFAAAVALWIGSRLLASIAAVGALALELLWNLDFLMRGRLGLAGYMFDPGRPLWLRNLSLFHVALPPTLLWMLCRLGYDRRALAVQTILAWVVLPTTFFVSEPRKNINWVFGPGARPQRLISPPLYLALLMAVLPLLVYLPSHLVLRRLFPKSRQGGALAPARSPKHLQTLRPAGAGAGTASALRPLESRQIGQLARDRHGQSAGDAQHPRYTTGEVSGRNAGPIGNRLRQRPTLRLD